MATSKPSAHQDFGSRSAEEQGFLNSIADNFLDPAPRQVYADWLEERGDPRSAFVRQLAAACPSFKRKIWWSPSPPLKTKPPMHKPPTHCMNR